MLSVARDPVGFWLGRLAPQSRRVYRIEFNLFLKWLRKQTGWENIDGTGLLARRRDGNNQYEVLDLLQTFVAGLGRTVNGKASLHTAVRSFFLHNRCALPDDRAFRIRAEKTGVKPKLSMNHLSDLVRGANLRDRSIILVKWQAMLDNDRTAYVGLNQAEQIVTQMKANVHPVRLDIPGRKSNQKNYYTYIGRDAIDALRDYFEKERGWPKTGEPIWIDRNGNPLSVSGFSNIWTSLTRRLGLIPKKRGDSPAVRYGFNPHEMRDLAKSLLHTKAKADGFDMDCAEFWLGHTVDPLGYDKFYQDTEYVKKQYLIAEKYLNIISVPSEGEEVKRQEDEIKKMQDRLEKLESIYSERIKLKE